MHDEIFRHAIYLRDLIRLTSTLAVLVTVLPPGLEMIVSRGRRLSLVTVQAGLPLWRAIEVGPALLTLAERNALRTALGLPPTRMPIPDHLLRTMTIAPVLRLTPSAPL